MKVQTLIQNLNSYKISLKVEDAVHEFLQSRKYLKINLPVLSPALIPESYLEIFSTDFKYLDKSEKLFLTPSPELFLKRLLAYGIGDCYYLGKAFRNSDPASPLHSFEFRMLEFYKSRVDYMGLADEVLKMLQYIAYKLNKKKQIIYKDKPISFERFEKITTAEAFYRYADIDEEDLFNHKKFLKRASAKNYEVKSFDYEDIWSQIYTQEIEPNLGINGYPTLIYDYPLEFAALAKLNSDNRTTQRFELYIAGIEIGDCYSDLTDWKEQELRFNGEEKKRQANGRSLHPVDKGFIDALKYGLVECAGIAIGFDRLAMIFANVDRIDKINLININS